MIITPRARRAHAFARALALAAILSLGLVLPVAASTTTTIAPGRLPQTRVEPGLGAGLNARMRILWRAILRDDPAQARSVFFPERAYLQMKTGAIPDPANDFVSRLVGFYDLDLGAYHRLVATGGSPTLVRVEAAGVDAAWIGPRECENLVGYWHLAGVRLVYRHGTRIYSVAVDSLISWRGVWYVVHLGPNPRPSDVGTVDGYTAGPGQPGPAGGC